MWGCRLSVKWYVGCNCQLSNDMLDAPLADWSNRCRREYLSPTLCSSNTSSIETLPRWYMDKMMAAYDAANCGLQMQDRLQWQWSWTCGHVMAFLCERVLILWSGSLSTGSFQWWSDVDWGYSEVIDVWRCRVHSKLLKAFVDRPLSFFVTLGGRRCPFWTNKRAI